MAARTFEQWKREQWKRDQWKLDYDQLMHYPFPEFPNLDIEANKLRKHEAVVSFLKQQSQEKKTMTKTHYIVRATSGDKKVSLGGGYYAPHGWNYDTGGNYSPEPAQFDTEIEALRAALAHTARSSFLDKGADIYVVKRTLVDSPRYMEERCGT